MFQINTGESPVLIRMEFSKDSQEPESHQDPVHGWFLQLHAHQTNFLSAKGPGGGCSGQHCRCLCLVRFLELRLTNSLGLRVVRSLPGWVSRPSLVD